jgi:hypothetical protein
MPRGAAGFRGAIKSYSSVEGTFTWDGYGSIAKAYVTSLSAAMEAPEIFSISTELIASR